jgi:hypothetical protein
MPLAAPVFPSQHEDVNVPLRGVDDTAFKWRHPTLVGTTLGGLTIDHFHLQITPDLGWSDATTLFTLWNDSTETGNARLHEFSSDELGNAVFSSEEITYTLPQIDWESVIRPRFQRYFWRVAAIEADDTVGAWSEIQTFEVIPEIPEDSWTIGDPAEPLGFVQVLRGTYDPYVETIEVLGHDPVVTMEDGNWKLEIPLSSADQLLYVRARNLKGELSPYRIVRVKLSTTETETFEVWNSFDEHGMLLSTPRLPGEGNADYRARIKDVMVHRGSPRYIGLRNSLTRDLGYLDEQRDRALLLTRNLMLHTSDDVYNTLRVANQPGKFLLLGDIFQVREEEHVVNGHDWSITLDHQLEDLDLRLVIDDREVSFLEYDVIERRTIRFRTPEYNGRKAFIDYRYVVEVETAGLTLNGLKTALEAVTVQGEQLITATVESGAGALSAEGLDFFPPVVMANFKRIDFEGVEVEGVPVRWSPVRIFALQDPEFLAIHENEFGNLFQTKVDGWSKQLNAQLNVLWEQAIADRSIWFDRSMLQGHASLPATTDLPKLFWRSTRTGQRYTTRQYVALSGLCPYDGSRLIQEGVPIGNFRSGVSPGLDLKVRISEDATLGIADPTALTSIVQTQEDSETEDDMAGPTDPTEVI